MSDVTAPVIEIVAVTDANWRTYRDVRLAALLDTPRAFASTYAGNADRDDASWLARLETTDIWLAFWGDRPIGTVAIWHADDQPEDETFLIGMWVSASARGHGVGDQLIVEALASAAAKGFARVHLDVAEENLPARRLYERHGFALTGGTWDNPLYGGIRELGYAVTLPTHP
ncbi:GNAT family N-acetyltransferase [Knoellia subterranea]|uniref:GNAT family N-acetyltransferase n=1 Tax=Knoellia subterranea TaxID=184882 RepID=UPI0006896797|nr:GNAT family N-acetyltransferase [Knoellia subterranea]